MVWRIRSFLSKWKPAARFVLVGLVKVAGGVAAANDPDNEQVYKCLAAGGEQAAEHVFDALSDKQKQRVDERFTLLEPFIHQQIHLVEQVEKLVEQQAGQIKSLDDLEELIRHRLPAELRPALQQLATGLDEMRRMLTGEFQKLHERFDQLERKPKSAYHISIDDPNDVAWLRQVIAVSRGLPAEQLRKLRLGQFAGLLQEAGLYDAASEVCTTAAALAPDNTQKAALLMKKVRADLEQQHLDDALTALREAAQLDPGSAPFPARKYQPLRLLGVGGFGTAVLCRDTYEDDKEVVVKCLHAEGMERKPQEMFREVPVLQQLHRAYPQWFVNVHYATFVDDVQQRRPYIVMDYFAGMTLTRLLEEKLPADKGLPLHYFLPIALPIAQALQAAHQYKIYHRDLKPDNVLVRLLKAKPEAAAARTWDVRVIDFGLALRCDVVKHSASQKAYSRALLGAAAAGTAKYAPPEQMQELNYPIGPYSDVYAFGKTCWQMLFRTLERQRSHWAQLSEPLAQMLEKCLEWHPEGRYQDFGPIVATLQALAGQSQATPDEAIVPFPDTKVQLAALREEPPVVVPIGGGLDQVRERKSQEREQIHTEARQLDAACRYEEAVVALEKLAEHRRDAALHAELCRKRDRVKELLPKIEQLIHDDRLESWHRTELEDLVRLLRNRTDLQRILAALPELKVSFSIKDVGITMRLITPGRFLMGSPKDEPEWQDNETPHWVTLTKPFYLAAHPVTRGQFRRFVKADGYKTEAEREGGAYGWTGSEWKQDAKYNWLNPGFSQDDDHPVVCVSHNDAVAFCAWLKRLTGQEYSLPSEAQWEYACRGRALSSGGVEITSDPYHFGKTITPKQANFHDSQIRGTTKVGSYPPANGFGLFDMHGNVLEWCADWYGPYSEDPNDNKNPQGVSKGDARVLRGGCWSNLARDCRAAYRGRNAPALRFSTIGFRVGLRLD